MISGIRQRWSSTSAVRLLLHGMLILNFGLGVSYILAWVVAARQDYFWRADFGSYFTGWAMVRDGLGNQLYNFDLQTRYQQEILNGRSFLDGLLPFIYPPGIVLLFTPLSYLPRSTAFYVWSIGQMGLLIWLTMLLRKITEDWTRLERWLLLGSVIALPSMLTTIFGGQLSMLVLVCVLQFYISLKHRREGTAAIWFFLGAIKPQLMLAPGMMVVASRRWRTTIIIALFVAGMGLISSLLLGWQIWLSYFEKLRLAMNFYDIFGFYISKMYNFRGGLTTLLGNGQAVLINGLSTFAMLANLAVIALLWRGEYSPEHPDFELRMALTLTSGLFFCIYLFPQDALLYVAPALLFYDYLRKRGLPRAAFGAFVLACPFVFLFSMFNLDDWFFLRVPVIAALILMFWIGKACLDASRLRVSGSDKFPARKGRS